MPADEAISAFNAAIALEGDDVEALRRHAWTLEGMARRLRGSVPTALALMHTRTLLGDRAAAIAIGDELWGRRATMEPDDRQAFAVNEYSIGRYDRASALIDVPDGRLTASLRYQRDTSSTSLILATWKPELIRRYGLPATPAIQATIYDLDRAGLLPIMAERQALVNEIVGPSLCGQLFSPGTDGDDGTMLLRTFYVNDDYEGRQDLALRIAVALEAFHEANGLNASLANWVVCELVMPVSARGPLMPEAIVEAA